MGEIEVGAFEAKNRLSELLSQVERGQRIYITRRGKRVAMLVPADAQQEGEITDLLREIQDLRRTAKSGPESLRSLIEEGRR